MAHLSNVTTSLLLALGMFAGLDASRSTAEEALAKPHGTPPPGLARKVQSITGTVLRHHLEPPARQQMLLTGIRNLYAAAGLPLPPRLSERVSSVATPEQFESLLAEVWPSRPARQPPGSGLEGALIDGILSSVPGTYWLSAKEHKVQEQLAGNRYVGVHIQVRYDEKEKRTIVQGLIPGGPADRAGMMKEDRIEAVDGADTRNASIAEVVDRLRGESGTDVAVRVRQPGAKEARTLTMTHRPLFLPTVTGLHKRSSGEWDYRADDSGAIGYLKLGDLSASTPQELRRCAEILQDRGYRAVVLDLRGVASSALHPTVLLADSLLDRGRIGQVRQADGVVTYDATPGSLFRDWPIAVLIDSGTSGASEWLAAALQDNHRAILVGTVTSGAGQRRGQQMGGWQGAETWSAVPIGPDEGFLNVLTGRLERGDGRPIAHQGGGAPPGDAGYEAANASPSVIPKGGVKPDRALARPNPSRRGGGVSGEVAPPGDPWTDPILIEAVKLLASQRTSL